MTRQYNRMRTGFHVKSRFVVVVTDIDVSSTVDVVVIVSLSCTVCFSILDDFHMLAQEFFEFSLMRS